MEHTHGDVQKVLEIRLWSYGRKSKMESTIFKVIPTKKIFDDTKGYEIPEKVVEEDQE